MKNIELVHLHQVNVVKQHLLIDEVASGVDENATMGKTRTILDGCFIHQVLQTWSM